MSRYKYYIFEYHTRKLACFDLLEEASESDFISVINLSTLNIDFDGHSFEKFPEFLRYIGRLNEKTAQEYEANFKIRPPYKVWQEFRDSICYTFFKGKGRQLGFTPGVVPSGRANMSPIDDFLQSMMDHSFSVEYMIKLHNFLINSMIVRPTAYSGTFHIILPDKKPLRAAVAPTGVDKYCLMTLAGVGNDAIFKSYGIARDLIRRIIEKNGYEWIGQWPETDRKTVYEIINYINANYYAGHAGSYMDKCVIVSGFHISYSGHDFVIRKHENGKWYIDGEIALIISMFGSSNIAEFRKFVDNVLGKKFRKGVFPECDSKEEILILLNKITKCPT